MYEAFLVAVGNFGRWLYEWADHRLEAGDSDVMAHAMLRFKPKETKISTRRWYDNGTS
jgi:hypothetical protein